MGVSIEIFRRAALVLGLSATLAAPLTAAPVVLEPSSKWNLDAEPERCGLAREFGGPDNRHLLKLSMAAPSHYFTMVVAGREIGPPRGRSQIEVQFGDEPAIKQFAFAGLLEGVPARIMGGVPILARKKSETEADGSLPFSADEWLDSKRLASIDRLAVKQGSQTVVFHTGSLGAVMSAFNRCLDAMVASWGFDPVQQRRLSRDIKLLNRKSLVSMIDAYPKAALDIDEQGIVYARATVDEAGKVTDCVSRVATKVKKLTSPACTVLRRGKFTPALDAQGKPVPTFATWTVQYVVP